MKTISRNSFIVRVAYSGKVPSTVSLCDLVQCFLSRGMSRFAGACGIIALWIIIMTFLIVIGIPIGILVGYRPAFISIFKCLKAGDGHRDMFKEYPLPTISGQRVPPIAIMVVIGVIWFFWSVTIEDIFQPPLAAVLRSWSPLFIATCIGVLGYIVLRRVETCRVIVSFIKARWQQKMCVTLQVTE